MASKAFNVSMASTIARKFVMAVTGIFLVIFVIGHMLGNLSFIFGGPDAYNTYSHKLMSLGPLLYFIEITLLLIFIGHIVNGIIVTLTNRKARPDRYQTLKSAGAPSKQTLFSRSMAVTGVVLLVFTVIHLLSFKYGTYYTTTVNGVEMRDLYRLVDEKFRNPIYAFGYIAVMLLLFSHIRHGFWSAFQSLGTNKPRYSNLLYQLALIIAIVVAFGFIAVPLKVYFGQFIAG